MDHPGALRHPADGEAVARDDRLLRRVSVVRIASAASAPPSAERRPPSSRAPRAGGPSAAARRSRRSRGRAPARARARAGAAVSAAVASASSSPCLPVAAFATPELITTACGSAAARCAFETSTGAACTRLAVNIAAPTAGTVERTTARSAFRRPDPGAHAAARLAAGRTPVRSGRITAIRRALPASRSPAVSSRPSARFAFWTAWPAAPLPRLSSAQIDDRAAGRPVLEARDLGGVGVLDARELGDDALREHRDDVARGVRRLEQRRADRPRAPGRNRWRAARGAPAGGAGRSRPGSRAAARSPARAGASRRGRARRSRARSPRATTPSACGRRPRRPTWRRRRRRPGSIAPRIGREREQRRGRVAAGVGDQPARRRRGARAGRSSSARARPRADGRSRTTARTWPDRRSGARRTGRSRRRGRRLERGCLLVLEAEEDDVGAAVERVGVRDEEGSRAPLRLSRGSSAVACCPASESEPSACSSSSGWARTRSSVSCPAYPDAPIMAA